MEQVIMLKTRGFSHISKAYLANPSYLRYSILGFKDDSFQSNDNQHLYITSDDEIKEGDWFIGDNISLKQCTLNNAGNINFKGGWYSGSENCKKIIATTDTSLKVKTYYEIEGNQEVNLPQPSQQFIEKYIESYNKGEVITNISVEYETDKVTMACTCKDNSIGCSFAYYDGMDECCRKRFPNGEYWNTTYKLKINSEDNTITVKI